MHDKRALLPDSTAARVGFVARQPEVRHISAATLTQRYFAGRTIWPSPPNSSEEPLVSAT